MPTWHVLERNGVRLACLDYGGAGDPALLLHGLAGHAGEWADTAEWLTGRCRVVALDARGHGQSERFPDDVSRAAHVADVVFAVEQLALGPVVLIGHSLGGLTALLVAAELPDLVRALVVADASPAQGDVAAPAQLREALGSWPVPFSSRQAAIEFFGGPSLVAEAWANGLERRDGGWGPRFDVEVIVQTLREANDRSYWYEWQRIRCPTLIVRAGSGIVPIGEARKMTAILPQARLIELGGAAHDLHLDRPSEWRQAVCDFLDGLGVGVPPCDELA